LEQVYTPRLIWLILYVHSPDSNLTSQTSHKNHKQQQNMFQQNILFFVLTLLIMSSNLDDSGIKRCLRSSRASTSAFLNTASLVLLTATLLDDDNDGEFTKKRTNQLVNDVVLIMLDVLPQSKGTILALIVYLEKNFLIFSS
jgi:hypothetical protein